MKRKAISTILVLAICLVNGCSSRRVGVRGGVESAEQFRQPVTERGTGENSKWGVELKDGRKIQGYTEEIREDGFTLVNWKTGEQYEVGFDEVASLTHIHTLSTGAKIAIFGGIAAVVAFVVWGVVVAMTHS